MFKGKVCNFNVICNPHVRLARKDLRTHAHVKRTHVRGAQARKVLQIHDDASQVVARAQVAELDVDLHAMEADAL